LKLLPKGSIENACYHNEKEGSMNQTEGKHNYSKDIQDGNYWTYNTLSVFQLIGATKNTIPDAIKIIHYDPDATIYPLKNVTFRENLFIEGDIKVYHYDLFGHLYKEDPKDSVNFGLIILELWSDPRIKIICFLPNLPEKFDWAYHYLNHFSYLIRPGKTKTDERTYAGPQAEPDGSSTLKKFSEPVYAFHQDGDHWMIRYENEEGHFKGLKGFRLIHVMLRNPLKEFTSIEISQAVNKVSGDNFITHTYDPDFGDLESGFQLRNSLEGNEPLIDNEAFRSYKNRIEELEEEIELIEFQGGDASEKKEERAKIAEHLRISLGKKGISRSYITDHEKARKNIQHLIKNSLNHIQSTMPLCYDHLKRNIHTGGKCYYSAKNNWVVENTKQQTKLSRS